MQKQIEFQSEGANLRGVLFLPENQKTKPPVVIMAHGTSATIHMVADKYAEKFCQAGLAVLLYDHKNFGRSGGEPRQQINPWIQCRGYRDAIDYIVGCDDIDSEQIALWGDSYTGGQVPFPSVRLNADTIIDLFPQNMWQKDAPDGKGFGNLNHFCFALGEREWQDLFKRLEHHSVTVEEGPAPRWGAHGTGTSIYFRDPEGNLIEARYYATENHARPCLLGT